jgi:hypothetical protein
MNGTSPSIVTTSTGTASVFNTNALTGNLFGAATAVSIGTTTGTINLRNATITAANATAFNMNGTDPSIATTSTGTASVFNTSAVTGNLFGAATAVSIGTTTGTINLRNATITAANATAFNMNGTSPSIVTTSTGTASVFNTNALTGNLFGAATTIGIGASTGTLTLNNATVTTPGQFIVTKANSVTTGQGQIYLNGTTGNRIEFAAVGLSVPDINTRSVGTKIVLWPQVDDTGTDYAFGLDTGVMWSSVHDSTKSFKWYAGATAILTLAGTGDITLAGDLAVNGGDITTTATTFNLINTTATILNIGGASTATAIGSTASGTTTIGYDANVKHDLIVDGDVQVKGGDLTTNQTTFNLLNTTATTVNAFGAATAITVGAAGANTFTLNHNILVGSQTTQNVFNTTATTVNAFGASTTTAIGSTASGTTTIGYDANVKHDLTVDGDVQIKGGDLTTDQTTFNLLNTVATTLNIGGNATTVNLGKSIGTVNIGVLALTTDLEVQYGGTGQSSFTAKGVIYGNTTSGLAVTAASNPGSNATTSYGVLTTDGTNVPVWTDVIDGGTY